MDQLLPHPTTVSRGVRTKAKDIRQLLGPEVRETFVEIGGSITFDLWTEDHTKTSYVGLTAHYCRNGKVIDNTVADLWLKLCYFSFVFLLAALGARFVYKSVRFGKEDGGAYSEILKWKTFGIRHQGHRMQQSGIRHR